MIAPTSPRDESVVEFTLRAALAGIGFGILFGAANAYLGLRVGLTVATSIPIAVLTVALFRLMGRRPGGMILEANLAQTIGSASSSLATGTIFTIPALFLWGIIPPYWQIVGLAFLGAILGITAMVPLRRLLIVQSSAELPYPEGTACAEVLRATAAEAGGGRHGCSAIPAATRNFKIRRRVQLRAVPGSCRSARRVRAASRWKRRHPARSRSPKSPARPIACRPRAANPLPAPGSCHAA